MTSPARFLLFVLLVILGVKATEQVYGFVAYRDERAAVRTLRAELSGVDTGVLRVQGRLDSLHRAIVEHDRALTAELKPIQKLTRQSRHRLLPPDLYTQYAAALQQYNLHVEARNVVFREWQQLDAERDELLDRYALLADSIHGIAVRMGKPYYQVPAPLEAAPESGIEGSRR